MKNKASLTLIEQVIMLLVLTVAAAVCLQIFVNAGTMSKKSELQDQAVQQAQSCAEILKSTGGNMEEAAALLGGTVIEGVLRVEADGITVCAEKMTTDHALLGKACVSVYSDDRQLCILNVCWQEVGQ